jgi:hypothetical protein
MALTKMTSILGHYHSSFKFSVAECYWLDCDIQKIEQNPWNSRAFVMFC